MIESRAAIRFEKKIDLKVWWFDL